MNSLGTQYVAEFINCNTDKLSNQHFLEQSVKQALELADLHVVKFFSHAFEPDGITLIAIISESHFAMHTYPESNLVSLDLYTCTNGEKHAKFIDELKQFLKPENIRQAELNRGNPIDFKNANWITSYTEHGFETRYYIKELFCRHKSDFQLIEIINNDNFGKMLFLDKDLQIAESDSEIFNNAMIAPITKHAGLPEKVLILGGGDGGIVNSLVKLNAREITVVDIDADVIHLSKKHLPQICGNAFESEKVKVIHEDVFEFFKNGEKYDAVVYDLTMYPEKFTSTNRKNYLTQLFKKVSDSLSQNGQISIHIGSAHDKASIELFESIMLQLKLQVELKAIFLPSFCEERMFAYAVNL